MPHPSGHQLTGTLVGPAEQDSAAPAWAQLPLPEPGTRDGSYSLATWLSVLTGPQALWTPNTVSQGKKALVFLPILSFTSPGPKYGTLQKGSPSPANPSSSQARQAGHHLPLPPCFRKELVCFSLCQSPWPAYADSRKGLLLANSQPMQREISHTQHQQLHPFHLRCLLQPILHTAPPCPYSGQVSYTSICIRNTKSHERWTIKG